MSTILISIISLLLIAAMVISGFYFLGDTTKEQKVEAEAAQLRNEASQIAAAVKLYNADGNTFGENFRLETLVDMGYLKQLPEQWEPGEDKIMHVLDDPESAENICFTANKQAGFKFDAADVDVTPYSKDKLLGIPSCDKVGLSPLVPCCTN